ncbi:DNA-binding transcriptional regulator, ArsR family [Streptomyces sp. LamerLS-316]|uniref:ArsR/SmtB family transcription factor n=1 Tax=Streptomyces sp. SID4921 TaxID=2690272 RepID=UPI0008238EE9|nr:helix-turn-helix transcriptional regulator [Streptomyces sp. LamerLS-316]MYQ41230.1 helix-turn-helix domain-containing protein [Streptomyces sp. SID4921]SCK08786.1 DNA-binding transcriptional regulator, ArsR family [Streptomyces sp. LamerLS-316]
MTTNAARVLAHPSREEIRVEGVLHALSDPIRLRIVRQLAGATDEQACSRFDLPVSKSTTTHHFRVLRENGVIAQFYRGTAKLSCVRTEDLDALFPGLLDSVLAGVDLQAERLGRTGASSPAPAGKP